jgi:hypothetical protein
MCVAFAHLRITQEKAHHATCDPRGSCGRTCAVPARAGGWHLFWTGRERSRQLPAAAPLWAGFYIGGSAGFGAGDTSGRPRVEEGFVGDLDFVDLQEGASGLFDTDY